MSHIDDPCDAHDEWEKRARRRMAWDWLAKALPDMMLQPYQRDYMDALLRSSISNELIIIEPKRPAGNSYVERGDIIAYWMHTAEKDTIPVIPDNRRFFIDEFYQFIAVDHAVGSDFSASHPMPAELKEKRKVERFDRQQPPHWKGKRPR